MRTPCKHWFCQECILGALEYSARANGDGDGRCPTCRAVCKPAALAPAAVPAVKEDADVDDDKEAGVENENKDAKPGPRGGALKCESKLQVLLAELRKMREDDPGSKALVFSQYHVTLEWLKQRLTEEGFQVRSVMKP
mmetsp:Transcript_24312/g.76582  ORF Transcript_24312/g.76582 Transcript_24312/m.76582 type:complete len:138 (-) Transcript_24312:77-490(-)